MYNQSYLFLFQTLADVNAGKIRESTLEKYLYKDESKEEYAKRLKEE